ncbi:MAG: hypothetical protein AABZ39_00470 [Spirochaetota bacterium]
MPSIIARRTFLRHSLGAAGAAVAASVTNVFGDTSPADLKSKLVKTMKESGAYDVRIADPRTGFEHALSMPNPFRVESPRKLWPQCRSIVVIIAPYPPVLDNNLPVDKREAQLRGLNSGSTDSEKNGASFNVYHPLTIKVMSRAFRTGWQFLVRAGYQVKPDVGGVQVQSKLAAYEAGIGVYGRSGLILHPELGNRMVILTLMTDAVLPPDEKLISFTTNCKKCGVCVKTCRGKCYRADKDYPTSYTVTACAQSRNEVLMKEGGLCQNCFANCPASEKSDEELLAWLQERTG